jgi:hypothetical protein
MKKSLLIASILLGLTSIALAGPKVMIPKTHWDFGKAPQNCPVTHAYWIKNVGDDTLKNIVVKPGCGCTSSQLQKTELLPGDSTSVELIFNTRTYKGKMTKSAKVTTNDTTQANLSIDFSVNVFPGPDTGSLIRLLPDQVRFGKDTTKQTVQVENLSNSSLNVAMIDNVTDNIRYKIKSKEIKPGQTGILEFEWRGGEVPKYDVNRSITFSTALDSIPYFSIPYTIKGTEPTPTPVAAKKLNVPQPIKTETPQIGPNTGQFTPPPQPQIIKADSVMTIQKAPAQGETKTNK